MSFYAKNVNSFNQPYTGYENVGGIAGVAGINVNGTIGNGIPGLVSAPGVGGVAGAAAGCGCGCGGAAPVANVVSYCADTPSVPVGVGGISDDSVSGHGQPCGFSLRDAACRLLNQKAIINVDGCRMCVTIMGVGQTFVKAVNPNNGKLLYFNLFRINSIEDVLPRCYC